MRRLLMLTYHFPPSAASGTFRLLGFAQHLPKFGWPTAVVAPPGLPWEPTDPGLVSRVPAGTTVISVPYPRSAPKVLRWLAPYRVWQWAARRPAEQAVRELRPDAILTSGPPHGIHLLGRSLKRTFGIPWVADFRDPWVRNEPMPRLRWCDRWDLLCEEPVMRGADMVIANAPRAKEMFQRFYPYAADRIVSLTNGFDPELFPSGPANPQGGPVRVLHAGELYVGRDPRPLLDALLDVPAETVPFRLEFVGRTRDHDANGLDLAVEVTKRGLGEKVHCFGQRSYQESLKAMSEADVLLLMDSRGRKIGVPAKLYEYLGAGRPILALGEPDGDLAAVLDESGVPYRIAPPHDSQKIRAALLDLITAIAEKRLPSVDSKKRLSFTRESLAGSLAKMLNQLTATTSFMVSREAPREAATACCPQ